MNSSSLPDNEKLDLAVDTALYSRIITFILATSPIDMPGMQSELAGGLLYNSQESASISDEYGIKYLGELLERFREKIGNDIRTVRAIALALAFAGQITPDEMFVGAQRSKFVRMLAKDYEDDFYVLCARYLITTQSGGDSIALLKNITEREYDKTEEILLALSLFSDFEQGFSLFRQQLKELLGASRSFDVSKNTGAMHWLILRLPQIVKSARGKDIGFFRALSALQDSHVKSGSKHHDTLLEEGFTAENIALLNYIAINATKIIKQKVVVEFLVVYYGGVRSHSQGIYSLLKSVFSSYRNLQPRCYGQSDMLDVLENFITLNTADSFISLYQTCDETERRDSSLFTVDVTDKKWDILAVSLSPQQYTNLTDRWLTSNENLSGKDITACLKNYKALTDMEFLTTFAERSWHRDEVFILLVEAGVIDLELVFENKSVAVEHVWDYIEDIKYRKAFDFLDTLFGQYTLEEIKAQINGFDLERGLFKNTSYHYGSTGAKHLNIKREFLSVEESYKLLGWIGEYIFKFRLSSYNDYIRCIIMSDSVADIVPFEERQLLFREFRDKLSESEISRLKETYFTPQELQSDKDAAEKRAVKAAEEKLMAARAAAEDELNKASDGTLTVYSKLTDKYEHSWHNESRFHVYSLFSTAIGTYIDNAKGTLSRADIASLLFVFSAMIKDDKIEYRTLVSYLEKIKHVEEAQ